MAVERSRAGIVIALALIGTLACQGGPAGAVEQTPGFIAVQRAFLHEDFEMVASLARTFLAQHPEAPEGSRVSLWLALSLERLQQVNESLKEVDALKGRLPPEDPLWPELLYWEGEISRRALKMVRAQLAYQQLLDRHPTSGWTPQALMGLGLVAMHHQVFASAVEYFHEVALRQGPSARQALLLMGVCRLRLSQFEEAARVFRSLIDQPHDEVGAQAAFYLGESLTGLERYAEAAEAYRRAAGLAEDLPWRRLAWFGEGWAEYRAGRCEDSLQAFQRYLASSGTDRRPEALFAQSSCLMRLGREQDALDGFWQLVTDHAEHPLAFESGLSIADLYRREERLSDAKALLHTMLRWPLDARQRSQLQVRLAAVELDQGNAAQAKTVFQLAAEQEDPSIRQAALNGLGDVELFLGSPKTARAFYQQAVACSPSTASAAYATYQLARIDLETGNAPAAIATFRQLMDAPSPALAQDARLALVSAYADQGEEESARVELEALRRDRPPNPVAARSAYYRALLAIRDGDEAAAERWCKETLAGAPKSEEALESHLLLADLWLGRTSSDEVIQRLRDVYATSGMPARHQAKLAKRLGDLAAAEQDDAAAIQWYEDAEQLLPALAGELTYRIATCFEEAGDIDVAIARYLAIDQPTWHVRGQLAAAKLLERQDRMDEARAIYESLAGLPIPEAKVVRERISELSEGRL